MKSKAFAGVAVLRFLFALLNLASCPSILAQQSSDQSAAKILLDSATLKERLIAACDEHNLPGIWAGRFFIDERPAIVEVSGIRKWGDAELAEADDIIHLGSCTKAMTAVIIAQLCSEGKLRLDSTLGEVFSDMTCVTDSDWSKVTITQLLQHRSGAVANFLVFQLFDQKHPDSVVAARQALLEAVCKTKRPREQTFVYSNVGFILLGHVAEQLEGKPWEQLMSERLFKPLGMESAGFGPVGRPDGTPNNAAAIPHRPWGHMPSVDLFSAATSLLGGKTKPSFTPQQIDNALCLGPAGRAHMNLSDWSKFVLPFARKDGYRQLNISSEIWMEMLTPSKDPEPGNAYAAGWIVIDKPAYNGRSYFHNGSNTTWYCYAFAVPGKQQCILVATNVFTESARKACDDVARFIVNAVDE